MADLLSLIGITPLDTLKTTMQVEGQQAKDLLMQKVKREGFSVLYQGGLANAVASFVGSYPWFFTFNFAVRAAESAAASAESVANGVSKRDDERVCSPPLGRAYHSAFISPR